jgi:DNA-binding NarL/FixJ family response regulator
MKRDMLSIRVLIVDDQSHCRQALRCVCETHSGFEVVGEAESGREAVELDRRLQPHVILVGDGMPTQDGVQVVGCIIGQNPEARIIVLGNPGEKERVLAAIKGGAQGYLHRDVTEQALIEAIRAAHHCQAPLDPRAAAAILDEYLRICRGDGADQATQRSGHLVTWDKQGDSNG